MSEEDLIGSFFAEIEHLPPVVDDDTTATNSAEGSKDNSASDSINNSNSNNNSTETVKKIVTVSQTISKPAELIPHFTPNTTVYSYTLPDGYDPNYNYDNSFSGTNYTDTNNSNSLAAIKNNNSNKEYVAQMPAPDKKFVRKAADCTWVDETLNEWPENDYRIFVGDLGKEVTTEMIAKLFCHYKSYAKAKVFVYMKCNCLFYFAFVTIPSFCFILCVSCDVN